MNRKMGGKKETKFKNEGKDHVWCFVSKFCLSIFKHLYMYIYILDELFYVSSQVFTCSQVSLMTVNISTYLTRLDQNYVINIENNKS